MSEDTSNARLGRTVAVIRHYLRGDTEAADLLLREAFETRAGAASTVTTLLDVIRHMAANTDAEALDAWLEQFLLLAAQDDTSP